MATKKKMLQAAAGAAGAGAGGPLDVEDVFSTYLYTGNSSTQTITNGIDIDGEGGLVWVKSRSAFGNNMLFDTERGVQKRLITNSTAAEATFDPSLEAFNSDGFTVGNQYDVNNSGMTIASWTFRKAPKFFDVVTYTGNGVAGREIAHNLGTTVGMFVVRRTDAAANWPVYHRGMYALDPDGAMQLNNSAPSTSFAGFVYFGSGSGNVIPPTDSVFTVGSDYNVNDSGGTYIAYLFAHNDGDGEFGPDSDQDIIKCGSAHGEEGVNLGFEPQFIMFKKANGTENWSIVDAERAMNNVLEPNTAGDEANIGNLVLPSATGFDFSGLGSSSDYIYMAIKS